MSVAKVMTSDDDILELGVNLELNQFDVTRTVNGKSADYCYCWLHFPSNCPL